MASTLSGGWFRSRDDERYFDVETFGGAIGGWAALREAHERFRAEPGRDPMRGWWMDRWQALIVPAGTDRPRFFKRVQLAWRRWTR